LVSAGTAFIESEGAAAVKAKKAAMEVERTCKVAAFKKCALHECASQQEANSRLEAAGIGFFKVGKMKTTLADYAARFKSESEVAAIVAARKAIAKEKAAAKKAEKAAKLAADAVSSLQAAA
jgi:hypothetical protein